MISTRLSILAESIGGQLIGGDCSVNTVFTDSRHQPMGGLFVALKGPNFDAHEFVAQVENNGAKAVMVEQQCDTQLPQIIVADTQLALGKIAKFNRQQLLAKFVAITGSCGKTTVKEMLSTILGKVGHTFATKGNLNNEIGAPLSLLEMDDTHQYGVIELGANHAGEIDYTASLTLPDVAMINNVQAAHIEGFGSLQGVAQAKGEIYGQLKSDGIAVINNDDEFADFWKQSIDRKIITYSVVGEGDITASNITLDENFCALFDLNFKQQIQPIKLSLAGEHNIANALAAASCAIALGVSLIDIAEGLADTQNVQGRLNTVLLSGGCRVIDDTYNANPGSMKAAIKLLQNMPGKRILVIGDMAELGELAISAHKEVGQVAQASKIDALYAIGALSKHAIEQFNNEKQHFNTQQELIEKLQQEAKADTTILCKGSRSAQMDKVVKALVDQNESANPRSASPRGEH